MGRGESNNALSNGILALRGCAYTVSGDDTSEKDLARATSRAVVLNSEEDIFEFFRTRKSEVDWFKAAPSWATGSASASPIVRGDGTVRIPDQSMGNVYLIASTDVFVDPQSATTKEYCGHIGVMEKPDGSFEFYGFCTYGPGGRRSSHAGQKHSTSLSDVIAAVNKKIDSKIKKNYRPRLDLDTETFLSVKYVLDQMRAAVDSAMI